ncbi:MAG: GbsR/MarR family transcriptional regulator [Candidatus Helarchaeota archaeon]
MKNSKNNKELSVKEEYEDRLISVIEDIIWKMGFEQLQGRIIGTLIVSYNDALSIDDLQKKTGYGASALSLILKDMARYGMVKLVKRPGKRKQFFSIEKQWLKNMLSNALVFNVMKGIDNINEIKNEIIEQDDPELEHVKEKIDIFLTDIEKMINLIKEFLKNFPF